MKLGRLLDLLYPRACSDCDRPLDEAATSAFCPACEKALEWIAGPACPRCGAALGATACTECAGKTVAFEGATALGRYDGRLRDAVLRLKFRGARHLADEFGRRLACRVTGRFEAVVPVPMSRWKRLTRGYNAAELVAERLARHAGLRLVRRALRKIRRTRPQADLPLEERRANPRGAYAARPLSGRALLVDDVLTTGATANACVEALRAAGAVEVHVAVIARAQE